MKFVAVCGFGVGSSLILAMSLQKVADKLGLDVEVENTDLTSAHSTDCDVIFTSPQLQPELSQSVSVPVLAVTRYMDLAEVESQVRQFLNGKAVSRKGIYTMELMNFIINSIFRNPPVLLGLIAALGLACRKNHSARSSRAH